MSKSQILFLFVIAGLILALVIGFRVYLTNLDPSRQDIESLLREYTEKISSGDLEAARQMMTEETREMLRDPGTLLGETIYRDLKLKAIDSVYSEGGGRYAADVVLTLPDTLKIMVSAGMLYGEKIAEEGPAEDPDRVLADIYAEILSRDDIPMLDNFCVIRLEKQNDRLFIVGNTPLQQVLEGGTQQNSSVLDALFAD